MLKLKNLKQMMKIYDFSSKALFDLPINLDIFFVLKLKLQFQNNVNIEKKLASLDINGYHVIHISIHSFRKKSSIFP